MKIREIIFESDVVKNKKKPRPEDEMVMPAVHRVAGTADRQYDLNRVMMAAASTDGKRTPNVPRYSWAGKNNIAAPYTKEESNMLKKAYKAIGVEWDDALKPNLNELSQEPKDTHKVSPYRRHGDPTI